MIEFLGLFIIMCHFRHILIILNHFSSVDDYFEFEKKKPQQVLMRLCVVDSTAKSHEHFLFLFLISKSYSIYIEFFFDMQMQVVKSNFRFSRPIRYWNTCIWMLLSAYDLCIVWMVHVYITKYQRIQHQHQHHQCIFRIWCRWV